MRKTLKNKLPFIIAISVVFLSSCTEIKPDITAAIEKHPTLTTSPTPQAMQTLIPTATLEPTKTNSPVPVDTHTSTPFPSNLQGTPLAFGEEVTLDNANELVQLARWGNGIAQSIQYSSDGEYLVVLSSIGLYIYETKNYSLIKSYDDSRRAEDVIFTPENNLLAVFPEGKSEIISLQTGETLEKVSEYVRRAAFSSDGKLLALVTCSNSECENTNVKIFAWKSLEFINEIAFSGRSSYKIEFSPNSEFIVIIASDKVVLWNWQGETEIHYDWSQSVKDTPYDLSISPNSQYFAISTFSDVRLFSVESTELLTVLRLDQWRGEMFCVEFSPDGTLLAVGSNQILLWQVGSGLLVDSFSSSEGMYTDLAWSKDGEYIVTASSFEIRPIHNSAIVWDAETGEALKQLDGFSGPKGRIKWSPDGNLIAISTLGYNNRVEVVLAETGGEVNTFSESLIATYVNNLSFLPNSIISDWGIGDKVFFEQVFDISNSKEWTLAYSSYPLAFSPDGQHFAVAISSQGVDKIVVYHTETGKVIQTFEFDEDKRGVGFVGNLVFGSSSNNIYAPLAGRALLKMGIENGDIETISKDLSYSLFLENFAVSPDEKSVIFFAGDGVHLVRNGNDNIIFDASLSRLPWQSVTWTPNGEIIAITSLNGEILLLDSENGKTIKSLSGHASYVSGLEFSPNGSILASVSTDGTIRLWGIP